MCGVVLAWSRLFCRNLLSSIRGWNVGFPSMQFRSRGRYGQNKHAYSELYNSEMLYSYLLRLKMFLWRKYYHFKRKYVADVFASGVKLVAQCKNEFLDFKYSLFSCAQSTAPLRTLSILEYHINMLLRGLFVSVALRTPSRQMRWSQRPQVMWYPLPQEVALKSWYRWHRNIQKR